MSDKIAKILAEPQAREFTLDRAAINVAERTVPLSFSSEEPVERWFGVEILDHSEKAADLSRLKRSGALLMDHDPRDQVGVVESVEIDSRDKKGRAIVRFGKSVRAQEIFQDVQDGIRSNVSVGYVIKKIIRESEEKGVETFRVTHWQPFEITLTSIPADIKVGVGRNQNQNEENTMQILREAAPAPGGGGGNGTPAPAAPTVNVQEVTSQTRTAEFARFREITALAKRHNCEDLTEKALESGVTVDEFRKAVLERQYNGGRALVPAQDNPAIGMSPKDIQRYSIVRAMNRLANKLPLDGLEKEVSDAVAKRTKLDTGGFLIPWDITSAPMTGQRAPINVTTPAQGGYLVETTAAGQSMIELLRKQMVVSQLGARSLSGLTGNVAIPRQTGGATAYWLDETAAVTESQQAFSQLALTPHRLAAMTKYTKNLLAQASIDVEAFVRMDVITVLAIAKDYAALHGTGLTGMPRGVVATTGVNTVTFTTAATWAKVLAFESEVAIDNALTGSLAWVTTPVTRAKWKETLKTAAIAGYLWQDDTVNGYPAYATNQFPSSGTLNQVIFGNWADVILADWDGIDVVVDPYTVADVNQVRVIVTILTDVGVRHAESFCVSTDSGAL